jgi:hypothetical protein
MAPGKAPSEGTKVTAGQNAPYTSEATGAVAPDSLAAESQTFRQSNEATAQETPRENASYSSRPQEGPQFTSGTGAAPRNVETAPSYVNNLYHSDPSGPHGKNIKEDDSIGTEDKAKNASFSEFGTKNDPGLAAEQKFTLSDTAPSGSIGERQQGITGKTTYDALGSEREA